MSQLSHLRFSLHVTLTDGPFRSHRQFEKFNLVLRFFTGKDTYTKAELPKGKESLPFLQKQCEAFFLGTWSETDDGGLKVRSNMLFIQGMFHKYEVRVVAENTSHSDRLAALSLSGVMQMSGGIARTGPLGITYGGERPTL